MTPNAPSRIALPLVLLLTLGLALLNVYIFYTGFLASDDSIYVSIAERIAGGTLALPDVHFGFRHTVLFPLAGLIAVAGVSEQTTLYLTLSYLSALVFLTVWSVHRIFGPGAALWFGLLLATTPIIVLFSSVLIPDMPEAIFLLASVFAFYFGWYHRRESNVLFMLAGLCAGLAIVTRETAYGIGLFYLLYALRYGISNPRPFIILGLATFAVVGFEMACYMLAGESPLYRIMTILYTHGGEGSAAQPFATGTGNLLEGRWLGAPMALLLNQEFGALFWLGIGCAIALRSHPGLTDETRRFLRYSYAAALVYFIWLGYSGAIRPLPRYFIFNAVMILIPIAVFVSVSKRKWLGALVILLAVGLNYASLSLDNINQRFPDRSVARFALAADAPVVSDPETAARGGMFMALMGNRPGFLSQEMPHEKTRTYYFAAVDGRFEENAEFAAMVANGEKLQTVEPPKLMVGRILDLTGLAGFLPEDKYWWLAVRTPSVTFYRLQR